MPANPSSRLWQPLKFGRHELQHRVALAPLTRFRADDDHVPLPFVADYYAQRGAQPGTLLITEATFISPQGVGYLNAPGLWTDAQIASWKNVTDAVHAKGSFLYAQLWAMGRAAQAVAAEKHGKDVVSASAIALKAGGAETRALTEEEILQLIKDYAQAAKNAVEKAGFDGVEIHGANGYLPDQFLQDVSNHRTDRWGGSIENRARFHIEIVKAVVDAIGADRVGIRLSPWSSFQDMGMADPRPTYTYLVQELKKLKLAFLHIVEPRIEVGEGESVGTNSNDFIVKLWDNQSPILLAGGLNETNGYETVDKEFADNNIVAVYGRYYISTPDLPYRLKKGIAFTPYERQKFYLPKSSDGYVTYPFSDEFKAEFSSQL